MSKSDQLRALREARYAAQQQAQQLTQPVAQKPGQMKGARPKVVVVDEIADFPTPVQNQAEQPERGIVGPVEQLCGHMSMGKKMCTRPKDHPEKYHRYGKPGE